MGASPRGTQNSCEFRYGRLGQRLAQPLKSEFFNGPRQQVILAARWLALLDDFDFADDDAVAADFDDFDFLAGVDGHAFADGIHGPAFDDQIRKMLQAGKSEEIMAKYGLTNPAYTTGRSSWRTSGARLVTELTGS